MKNKRVKVMINFLLITIVLLFMFSTNSNASSINEWIDQGNKFIEKGSTSKTQTIDMNSVKNAVLPIGQALVAVGTVILVVVTVVMGIKYMMCDSADQKAKLKQQLIGLVVATIVIFGAQVIWATLYGFMNKLF